MNRKEFGKLMAALRKGRYDEHYRQLTQQKLAEQSGISEHVLGKLERGEKISFEPDLLLALAHSLGLSTRERREFFLAAIGVNEQDMPASQPNPAAIFEELFENLEQIALPAFIVDSYDDIVAANTIILNLFEFSENLRKIAPSIVGGYNVLRFVFSERSNFQGMLHQEHEKYLMQSIRFFRAISLPCRANPYYAYLLSAFKKDRDMARFNQYYQRDMDLYNQDDYYFESERFVFWHPSLGELIFYSPSVFPVATSRGSLYLVTYIPASVVTIQACASLASKFSPGAMRLAPWPEKDFI
jgi:transcriptional regulator with XRE-family HTH domain